MPRHRPIPLNTFLLQLSSHLGEGRRIRRPVHLSLGGGLPLVHADEARLRALLLRWLGEDAAPPEAQDAPIALATRLRPWGSCPGASLAGGDCLELRLTGLSVSAHCAVSQAGNPLLDFGCHIQAHSGGSAFSLLFPVPSASSQGARPLVLVADDDFEVRQTTCAMVQTFGYDVLEARDGAEALKLFEASRAPISAVVLDVHMPVMDGLAAMRAIRLLSRETRIFLASGSGEDGIPDTIPGSAPDGFLHKPFKLGDLGEMLEQIPAP